MKKAILAASACMLALGAQAADLPAKLAEAGKLVAANTPNYPPMEYRDPKTNELKGLDIELGQAIAKHLGIEMEWSEIGFEQMPAALATGRADMILSGMSDLPDRREAMDFVDYMRSGAQFYVLAANAEKFPEMTDLCGEKIGMSRRTSFPDEALKWSAEHCEAQGKAAITIVGTEGSADARAQLRQGRVAAAVQGSETLPYLMQVEPDTYALVGTPFTEVFQGMAFAKDATGLRDAVAGAVQALIDSGEYEAIFDTYGLTGATLDKVQINGEPVN